MYKDTLVAVISSPVDARAYAAKKNARARKYAYVVRQDGDVNLVVKIRYQNTQFGGDTGIDADYEPELLDGMREPSDV